MTMLSAAWLLRKSGNWNAAHWSSGLRRPVIDASPVNMKTTWRSDFFRREVKASVTRNGPTVLTSRQTRKVSYKLVPGGILPSATIPALLTRTAERPNLVSTSAAAAWMEGSSVTSIRIASTESPSAFKLAGSFVRLLCWCRERP